MVQAHGHPESAQVNHVVAEAEARRSCHHEVEVRRREEQAVPRLEPAQRGRRLDSTATRQYSVSATQTPGLLDELPMHETLKQR